MGGSRRRLKKSKPKVQVGLPKKNPRLFKPAFNVPSKLRSMIDNNTCEWDNEAPLIKNYKTFGFVSNPNLKGARSRNNPRVIETVELQCPPLKGSEAVDEFELLDSGSDLEEDDLKSALGKKRNDGKSAPLQPLTSLQRVHIGRLIEKHGDDYKRMFMDTKLNSMQHSVAVLEKLCKRYHTYKDKNLMIRNS
ncbi:hypothetical protein IFM89_029364 [Coptis chinensis]|uniref:Nucleolar protein 16 n=1 Tax=Coptis chinensis TaxID=261450 RepID=A0A835IQK3_9MAGN|nr:hypothetical protein IFM89_029364 [Coptis chinensis]